jgi:hypothetical protein
MLIGIFISKTVSGKLIPNKKPALRAGSHLVVVCYCVLSSFIINLKLGY